MKLEGFFAKATFIARITSACSAGIVCFNDVLAGRNTEQLKTYLETRDAAAKPKDLDSEDKKPL